MSGTIRHCFALDLMDDADLIAEYENFHKAENIWPEITKSIHEAGIEAMEIYRVADRMFMIMEVGEGFDPSIKAVSDSKNPKVMEWEELMWRYQKQLPLAKEGEKWLPMRRIFCLSDPRV